MRMDNGTALSGSENFVSEFENAADILPQISELRQQIELQTLQNGHAAAEIRLPTKFADTLLHKLQKLSSSQSSLNDGTSMSASFTSGDDHPQSQDMHDLRSKLRKSERIRNNLSAAIAKLEEENDDLRRLEVSQRAELKQLQAAFHAVTEKAFEQTVSEAEAGATCPAKLATRSRNPPAPPVPAAAAAVALETNMSTETLLAAIESIRSLLMEQQRTASSTATTLDRVLQERQAVEGRLRQVEGSYSELMETHIRERARIDAALSLCSMEERADYQQQDEPRLATRIYLILSGAPTVTLSSPQMSSQHLTVSKVEAVAGGSMLSPLPSPRRPSGLESSQFVSPVLGKSIFEELSDQLDQVEPSTGSRHADAASPPATAMTGIMNSMSIQLEPSANMKLSIGNAAQGDNPLQVIWQRFTTELNQIENHKRLSTSLSSILQSHIMHLDQAKPEVTDDSTQTEPAPVISATLPRTSHAEDTPAVVDHAIESTPKSTRTRSSVTDWRTYLRNPFATPRKPVEIPTVARLDLSSVPVTEPNSSTIAPESVESLPVETSVQLPDAIQPSLPQPLSDDKERLFEMWKKNMAAATGLALD